VFIALVIHGCVFLALNAHWYALDLAVRLAENVLVPQVADALSVCSLLTKG